MFTKIKSLFEVAVTPKDYIRRELREVMHIDSLGLMKRNQDLDVIMFLVFRQPNVKAVADRFGVPKDKLFEVMSDREAKLVSWLRDASTIMSCTGLGSNDDMRRKKLRKLYDQHHKFIK